MNLQNCEENICRICLDKNVVLNWNNNLYEFYGITYKECYYKYTQLECLDDDPFSTMLCQNCLDGLQNIHTLILRAIQSHKYFEDKHNFNLQLADSSNAEDLKCSPTEFETILLEDLKGDITNEQCANKMPEDDEYLYTERKKGEVLKNYSKTAEKSNECQSVPSSNSNNTKDKLILLLSTSSQKKTVKNKTKQNNIKLGVSKGCSKDVNTRIESTAKNNKIKPSRMCSICSKVLRNKYAAREHEQTHTENRERKETCKVCGLKFYNKASLGAHRKIHNENRQKKHKCEFCNKAFYNKGELNIHRRIHLGQMISCSLCPKEFFREVDLKRHMMTHSPTTENPDTTKRTRYYVRCKHCDKSVLSTSFKSHKAAHLNIPLMKCSICDREFFSRASCVFHMKKIHKKTHEVYNDFIILYTRNRISRLFLEQNEEIQSTDIV